MNKCQCGFTQDIENNCDSTHKVVKKIKKTISEKIESINLNEYPGGSSLNAVGMKILVLEIINEKTKE